MSTKEEDYSAYLQHNSSVLQVYALFSGFVFTAITLLLTLLPDPGQIMAQVTLFFLAFLWILLMLIMFVRTANSNFVIRTVPPIPERIRRTMPWIESLAWFLLGVPVVLMFLLWNLTYLVLASTVMFALFYIFAVAFFARPSLKAWKKLRTSSK